MHEVEEIYSIICVEKFNRKNKLSLSVRSLSVFVDRLFINNLTSGKSVYG